MDTGSILILFSLLLVIAAFVAKPIFDSAVASTTTLDQEKSSLLAEREQILDALQELDFDFRLGKIPEGDYPIERTRLLQRGASILKDLQDLETRTAQGRPKKSDLVEKAIADRRAAANSGPRQPVTADDEIERLIAARRRDLSERLAGFCSQCGQAIQQSDKFCSKCGQPV